LIRFGGHRTRGQNGVQDESKKKPGARRTFTEEFKAGAVRLVLDEGKSRAQVARDLDLPPSALSRWVERARADRTHGKTGLTMAEREELGIQGRKGQ